MNKNFFPLGETFGARADHERLHEEVYSAVPALNALANASVGVSNKLTQEARNALFFESSGSDSELRVMKVEVGLIKRHEMVTAQPDIAYLSEQQPVPREQFSMSNEDEWNVKS